MKVLSSLIFPIIKYGKLIKSSGEAKVLCECSIHAQTLVTLWPMLTMSLVNYQLHLANLYKETTFKLPEHNSTYSFLLGVSNEQKLIIQRLTKRFFDSIKELSKIRIHLIHFAEINEGVSFNGKLIFLDIFRIVFKKMFYFSEREKVFSRS